MNIIKENLIQGQLMGKNQTKKFYVTPFTEVIVPVESICEVGNAATRYKMSDNTGGQIIDAPGGSDIELDAKGLWEDFDTDYDTGYDNIFDAE